jgi:hypothetical protein
VTNEQSKTDLEQVVQSWRDPRTALLRDAAKALMDLGEQGNVLFLALQAAERENRYQLSASAKLECERHDLQGLVDRTRILYTDLHGRLYALIKKWRTMPGLAGTAYTSAAELEQVIDAVLHGPDASTDGQAVDTAVGKRVHSHDPVSLSTEDYGLGGRDQTNVAQSAQLGQLGQLKGR